MSGAADTACRKDVLLEAVLPHVVFEGWSRAALDAGARSLGLAEDEIGRLFPGGVDAVRQGLDEWADRRMVESLRRMDLAALRMHQRVAAGVKARLAALGPWREAVRLALASRFSPWGAVQAAQAIYRTVDTIWWEVGDEATDFSFYTKRGILAAIHASAVLYWLGDTSEGSADTESYIDRRIADAGRIPKLRRRAEDVVRRCREATAQLRREARL